MRNFYLLDASLTVSSVAELENGLKNLNSLVIESDKEKDKFIRSSSIWEYDTSVGIVYELLFSPHIINPELQRILPGLFNSFIEQDIIYNTDAEIDADYPDSYNAFVGINFIGINCSVIRQIYDSNSYSIFVVNCLKFGRIRDKYEMKASLTTLYPNYTFSERAVDECLAWKQNDLHIYTKLFELFDDITQNPFTGGIGLTEVLRHDGGTISKRINLAHRVTYKAEKSKKYEILACYGHYS